MDGKVNWIIKPGGLSVERSGKGFSYKTHVQKTQVSVLLSGIIEKLI